MSRPGASVSTTDGEVTLAADALRIRRTPTGLVRHQLDRSRHGTPWQRANAMLTLVLLPVLPVLFVLVLRDLSTTTGLALAFAVAHVGASLVTVRGEYHDETTVPVDAVEDVSIDPEEDVSIASEENALTITYDPAPRDLRPFWVPAETKTTVRLGTTADVHDARRLVHRLERSGAVDRSGRHTRGERGSGDGGYRADPAEDVDTREVERSH